MHVKTKQIVYNHCGVINVYITFRLRSNKDKPDFGIRNCLFGAVKIKKDANESHYEYSGYGML